MTLVPLSDTVTSNDTYNYSPADYNADGFSSVSLTVAIPSSSRPINIPFFQDSVSGVATSLSSMTRYSGFPSSTPQLTSTLSLYIEVSPSFYYVTLQSTPSPTSTNLYSRRSSSSTALYYILLPIPTRLEEQDVDFRLSLNANTVFNIDASNGPSSQLTTSVYDSASLSTSFFNFDFS